MKLKNTLTYKLLRILFAPDLTGNDKQVLQYLVWRQGDHKTTWPGIRTIARELQISKTTVQCSINRLVSLRYLSRYRRRVGKSFNNVYTARVFHVPKTGTSAYQKLVHNFKQVNRDDPAVVEPVVSKAVALRETPGEKAMRKILEQDSIRRELEKQAERQAEQQQTADQAERKVPDGT